MQVSDAFISSGSDNDILVRLFNVHVPSGERENRDHRHTKFEIVVFKNGGGVYTTKRRKYSIKPGDVFVFSSNEQHCITHIDGDPMMHLMNLHIEPRYFWDSKFDSLTSNNVFFAHNPNFENRLPRNNPTTEKIKSLLFELEKEFDEKKPEYTMMIRAKIIEIFVSLIRELDYLDKTPDSKMTASTKPVKRALGYIQKHYTENITLKSIAEYSGMSPSYFSSYFYNVMGVKLWDYITEMRIEAAMRSLETNSTDTMMNIALGCGFNNTANFNKAFKKYTGRTPSEFRAIGKAALY